MARYSASVSSQTAQLTGVPVTTTVNGYIGYWGGSATSGFRLRRLKIGMLTTAAAVPTSQQYAIAIHKQTVAPSGTGLAAAVLGQALETYTPQTDPTTGIIVTTAATIGTTGPTIAAVPIDTIPLNSQSYVDVPWDYIEEVTCAIGTANGIAFVLMGGSPLPTNHFARITPTIEV
jgi:hypothetical protein